MGAGHAAKTGGDQAGSRRSQCPQGADGSPKRERVSSGLIFEVKRVKIRILNQLATCNSQLTERSSRLKAENKYNRQQTTDNLQLTTNPRTWQ